MMNGPVFFSMRVNIYSNLDDTVAYVCLYLLGPDPSIIEPLVQHGLLVGRSISHRVFCSSELDRSTGRALSVNAPVQLVIWPPLSVLPFKMQLTNQSSTPFYRQGRAATVCFIRRINRLLVVMDNGVAVIRCPCFRLVLHLCRLPTIYFYLFFGLASPVFRCNRLIDIMSS